MSSRYFVVPDLHGRHDLADALLDKAGVPKSPAAREDAGIVAVQLGDLANCVRDSVADDVEALSLARAWFDVVLVGNHEWPHVHQKDEFPFSGFHVSVPVRDGVRRLIEDGILKPCVLVGETLLTHAGVAAGWKIKSPGDAARAINAAWRYELGSGILTACSRARGGRDAHGGVLWRDDREPAADFDQVFGHTPHRDGPHVSHVPGGAFAINLDVGASKGWAERGVPAATRIVGLWLDADGQPPSWEIAEEMFVESP